MPSEPTSSSGVAPEPVNVRTLLCHRDVGLFIDCWRTLIACSIDPVRTVIHEDGSLTREDEAAILAAIPNCRVLWRRDADAIMAERLARHENARAFRAGSVWGLKLIDVAIAEPGDCFYVDGDIRFFRRFRGLFSRAGVAGKSVFLRDTVWTAYSIRPWHLLDRRKLKVSAAINTGLTLIDRACYDLDYVDWFLAQPDWRVIPAWTEPTCWAGLAAHGHGHAIDPGQVTNLYPSARVTPDTLGAHFLSAYRKQFLPELAAPVNLDAPIVDVRLRPLARLGALGLGANQLKRKLGNEWKRRLKR